MAEKKKKNPLKALLLGLLLLLLAVVMILFVLPQMLYRLQADPEPMETEVLEITEGTWEEAEITQAQGPDRTESAVELPLTLEDGRLQIESLFQFDGINPDCENQEQEHIAAILVKNISGTFLTEAKLVMELSDGTQTSFVVTNLPAERTAMAFSVENSSMDEEAACVSVSCQAKWDETAVVMPEGIAVSVEGITITLTNQTAQDIPELTVYCHSLLGEDFFGGITYTYKIEDLSANETTVIEAPECIMGMAEVVRVAIT